MPNLQITPYTTMIKAKYGMVFYDINGWYDRCLWWCVMLLVLILLCAMGAGLSSVFVGRCLLFGMFVYLVSMEWIMVLLS